MKSWINTKTLAAAALFLAAVLAGPAFAAPPTAPPELEGLWKGPGEGIRPDGTVETLALSMSVRRQVGQLFSGLLVVDRLDAEGGVIEQEGLLFTGHIDEGNRIAMTLIPFPVEPAPLEPAAATMHGTWAENTIKATWENLTFGNTGWATLKKQGQ